jgi:HEAT repeat protein
VQDLRLAAVRSLEETASAGAVDLLLAVVADQGLSPGVRDAATAALGRAGAVAVEPLLRTLADVTASDETRRRAIAALGPIGDPRAVGPLVALLGEGRFCVAAARALGRIGDRAALGPLLDAVGRSDHQLRIAALTALVGIADASVIDRLSALSSDDDSEVRTRAVNVLAHVGPVATKVLAAAALDRNRPKDVREAAVRALGEVGGPDATEALVAALGDERGQVRREAALALHALGDQRAIEPLAREIDSAIRNLFLSSGPGYGEAIHTLRRLAPASGLSDDLCTVVEQAAGYGTTWGGLDHNIEYVDLTDSDAAVERLCAIESPITSNVLHLVAAKQDISVTLALCNFSKNETIRFGAERARAEAELTRRGNPAYRPTAYMSG